MRQITDDDDNDDDDDEILNESEHSYVSVSLPKILKNFKNYNLSH